MRHAPTIPFEETRRSRLAAAATTTTARASMHKSIAKRLRFEHQTSTARQSHECYNKRRERAQQKYHYANNEQYKCDLHAAAAILFCDRNRRSRLNDGEDLFKSLNVEAVKSRHAFLLSDGLDWVISIADRLIGGPYSVHARIAICFAASCTDGKPAALNDEPSDFYLSSTCFPILRDATLPPPPLSRGNSIRVIARKHLRTRPIIQFWRSARLHN